MITSNINIEKLNISFDTQHGASEVVKAVDITFNHGEITGIIGESGSGKSLLGMSILKLLPSEARITGKCIYNQKNLFELDEKNMRNFRGREVAFIPQNPMNVLNPILSIGRQLVEHTMLHLNLNKKCAKKLAIEYLYSFGLRDPERIMKSYPFQLSGGMNQVVLFTMGVICKPAFVIADEPTKGLDSKIRKNVYDHLLRIKKNYVKSMIIITHDLYFAHKFCDTIAVMYRGEIVEIGKKHDVINRPQHPYTQCLLESTVKNGMRPIKNIDDKSYEYGCRFYQYCIKRTKGCLNPIIMKSSGRSKVRCVL